MERAAPGSLERGGGWDWPREASPLRPILVAAERVTPRFGRRAGYPRTLPADRRRRDPRSSRSQRGGEDDAPENPRRARSTRLGMSDDFRKRWNAGRSRFARFDRGSSLGRALPLLQDLRAREPCLLCPLARTAPARGSRTVPQLHELTLGCDKLSARATASRSWASRSSAAPRRPSAVAAQDITAALAP
jgi:hypothetical protein